MSALPTPPANCAETPAQTTPPPITTSTAGKKVVVLDTDIAYDPDDAVAVALASIRPGASGL
jgi:hypothetical protein